jgi:predicted DNA-binding transcriptional regulator AlpA
MNKVEDPRPARAVAWTSSAINDWMRARIAESGGDPSIVPDEPFRFLRLPEVESRVGLKRASIYRKMTEGVFPKPLVLGSAPATETATAA